MIHGADVVEHFIDVPRPVRGEDAGFGGKHVLQGALGAFDLAGEYGFLADVHGDEEIGMRQRPDRAIQTAQRAVGLREQGLQFTPKLDRRVRRQWVGDEGPVAAGLIGVPPGPGTSRRCRHEWLRLSWGECRPRSMLNAAFNMGGDALP